MMAAVQLLTLLCIVAAAVGKQPPHLVIMLVDDLGYHNVGFHNLEQRSPEIDRLAQVEGVILEAFYTFRYCSPTRSSLMTGRFPIHVNQGNPLWTDDRGGADLRMALLPQKLKRAGYSTATVGKWQEHPQNPRHVCCLTCLRVLVLIVLCGLFRHLGARSVHNLPGNRGFDYQFGFLGGGEDHMTQAPSTHPPYIGPDGQPYIDLWQTDGGNAGPAHGQNGTFSCELYGHKAVQHIEAHDPSIPLFFYVAFHDVHAPLQCPEQYLPHDGAAQRTVGPPANPAQARATYEGMLSCVSIATGNITDALKAKGMFDNSLIVWAADNGGPAFDGGNNFPLRGQSSAYAFRPVHFPSTFIVAPAFVYVYTFFFLLRPLRVVCAILFFLTLSRHIPVFPVAFAQLVRAPTTTRRAGGKMTDWQGGVRVAAFATGGLIPAKMRGTTVNGAMHVCDIHVTFCKLAGLEDCSDDVPELPGVDGVDVSELFFTKEADPSGVVGNASSPRQEIVLSSAALISGEWKFILPDKLIPDISHGACHPQPPGGPDAPTVPTADGLGSSLAPTCVAGKIRHNTGCTVGDPETHNTSTTGSWAACCAACAASSHCKAWTYHMSSGMCVLGTVAGVKPVHGAICSCVGPSCAPLPPPAPPAVQPGCGYWTGRIWPTPNGTSSPGYIPDPGCPPTGCLFHLPSDPREMLDLSSKYPAKLQELASRLSVLRAGQYQTRNYTAGCDDCSTMQQVAAANKGFLGPLCRCENPVVDNTKSRVDTNGQIVNAHQGSITWSAADRRYFWVGCAWVSCKEGPSGCNRTLIRTNQTWGSCGFNNNNMSVYSSATLANDDWKVETMDALPRATRAVGSYWQPNMVRADGGTWGRLPC